MPESPVSINLEDLMVVKTFANRYAAILTQGKLRTKCIPSLIAMDDVNGLSPEVKRETQLKVWIKDFEKAQAVLNQVVDKPPPDQDPDFQKLRIRKLEYTLAAFKAWKYFYAAVILFSFLAALKYHSLGVIFTGGFFIFFFTISFLSHRRQALKAKKELASVLQ